MITNLKNFIAGLIHAETLKIKEEPALNLKQIMATNSWDKIPEKKIVPVYVRDALVKVMNFIEFTPPAMANPNSTNLQKLEEISRNFIDDYAKWLVINEKNLPVTQILTHLGTVNPESIEVTKDEEMFVFLSSHLIQRYYLANKVVETLTPEPEAA